MPSLTPSEPPASQPSVLAPYPEQFQRVEARPIAARRIDGLDGTRVGFIDNRFTSLGFFHGEIRRLLEHQAITAVVERKRSFGAPLEPAQLARLVADTDVVVSGLCNTPPSSAWGVHDSIELERAGIPTVTIATAYYEELVAESALTEGMPDLRRVILPYPLEGQPEADVRAIARQALEPIMAALTDPAAETTVRVSG